MQFNKNILQLTKDNNHYRAHLITGSHSQIILMSVPVGKEIGAEVHEVDQILIFVEGQGTAIINGNTSPVVPGHLVFVKAGTEHNFKNTGSSALKLFTIYAPAEEKPGTLPEVL